MNFPEWMKPKFGGGGGGGLSPPLSTAMYRVSVQWRIVPIDGTVSVTQHFLSSTGSAVFAISATTAVIELQTITDSTPESAQLFSWSCCLLRYQAAHRYLL